MTAEVPLTSSHPTRPYPTRSHTHTQVQWLSEPNPDSDWIRRETNVSTWFIQLYLKVVYDLFGGIDV